MPRSHQTVQECRDTEEEAEREAFIIKSLSLWSTLLSQQKADALNKSSGRSFIWGTAPRFIKAIHHGLSIGIDGMHSKAI